MEPKIDVRISSLEVDLRVPGNRDEFPFSLPSGLYRVISPSCYCAVRRDSVSQFGRENLSSRHSSGEKFICSGENILHHHPTEIAALSEQTSKYSNEQLVRTPNQYIQFFLSRYPSLLKDVLAFQDRMVYQECRNSWRPRAARTTRKRWS